MEEALSAYAQAGFTNVEFVLPLLKDWLSAGRTIEDARMLLRAHGLRPIGGFQTHVECFTAPESMQRNHDLHVENARLIHELGGGTLVVGTDGPSAPRADALDVIAETFRSLAARIEGMNVSIAIEFNWSPVVKSLHSALRVAEAVNHPQVGILFDPAHFYTTVTKFEHLTARSVRWIRHVHLDDMRDKPGDLSNCNSDRVLPGQGADRSARAARVSRIFLDRNVQRGSVENAGSGSCTGVLQESRSVLQRLKRRCSRLRLPRSTCSAEHAVCSAEHIDETEQFFIFVRIAAPSALLGRFRGQSVDF